MTSSFSLSDRSEKSNCFYFLAELSAYEVIISWDTILLCPLFLVEVSGVSVSLSAHCFLLTAHCSASTL